MDSKTHKMNEMKVLEAELNHLRPGARVYKQQQNSNVYFLASKDHVFRDCKRTLDELTKEYRAAEGDTPTTTSPRAAEK